MSYVKNNYFRRSEIDLADIAKALSHPARIRILKILSRRKTCICGQIVKELPLAQATVSQHLKELKRIGVIVGSIKGPAICYCLKRKTLNLILSKFSTLFSGLTYPELKPEGDHYVFRKTDQKNN
jgi:predicted transcriptional regulator